MTFIEEMKNRDKADVKTIVLPEAMDSRILKATEIILNEKIANIILIGNKEEIENKTKEEKIDIEGAKIVDPELSGKIEEYANIVCEADKSVELQQAKEQLKNSSYFGMIMVKAGDADGFVSGAMNTTKNILKNAMRVFKK